ncbi:MAG: hypothetical protein RMM17_05625 [Acidobacteriota bacterium]|nr:hypothetical protein [Blastocatellia bacterium]MDW8412145.1 hypothetical protein [Acidobacteriota bacterium]
MLFVFASFPRLVVINLLELLQTPSSWFDNKLGGSFFASFGIPFLSRILESIGMATS